MRELLLTTKVIGDLQWWIQNDKRIAPTLTHITVFQKQPLKGKKNVI